MSRNMIVRRIERRSIIGTVESIEFRRGVNLLLGVPNSGKTTWLRMLDFLLADPDSVEEKFDVELVNKYDQIAAELEVGGKPVHLERDWSGSKPKTKISFNDELLTPKEVQHQLLDLVGIPLLNFPKGNPYSGQTWPDLSFRMLLRHIYRQQKYWGDIVDIQPEGERTASLLQFLGLAELIFTEAYGQLVKKKIELDQLRARRQQFSITLNELARDILDDPGASVAVTRHSLTTAEQTIASRLAALQDQRESLITAARDKATSGEHRAVVIRQSDKRAQLLQEREALAEKLAEGKRREAELQEYLESVTEENQRLQRAEDASSALADLKITHCPACDQPINDNAESPDRCILCHQQLSVMPDALSARRLEFERERVTAEIGEAEDLLRAIQEENRSFVGFLARLDEQLSAIEQELRPARTAVSALIQQEVSTVDRTMGELTERLRQLQRIKAALELGEKLGKDIVNMENAITPLQEAVNENLEKVDFGSAADVLAEGMTDYLNAINRIRPNTWKHSNVHLKLGQSESKFRIGEKNWANALGGTDQLYFLMAYHYGLLTLTARSGKHYPGLSIIDTPGEFAGESIKDLENFIVEPFIELLSEDEMEDSQVIITGAAFKDLPAAHRVELTTVWTA